MSTLVHCRDCGWDARFRRPAAARRAVARHRCPPPSKDAARRTPAREARDA
ncbi:hypothetical protein [Amycolatopsis benzoatilytica]|uniref:hypothetical protein n=1 Tax=Amycolatopsis benzoatilytica TaxID=346045 RepID=UPI0003A96944|nr:hypothetical protein [Amycolatopsis benzoatilytica]